MNLFAEDFDLFQEKEENKEVLYLNLKTEKVKLSYDVFPLEQKNIGFSYDHFFSKKFASSFEALYRIEIDEEEELKDEDKLESRIELNLGGTYRFTRKVTEWVFLGSAGISFNNLVDDEFTLNHVYGRFEVEYTFENGWGVGYSGRAKMPLELSDEEPILLNHTISIIYQFNFFE